MQNLLPGIRVDMEGKAEGLAARLQINSGVRACFDKGYSSAAFVPESDWRELESGELNILTENAWSEGNEFEFVSLRTIPQSINRHFTKIRTAIAKHNKRQVILNSFNHPEFLRGMDAFFNRCNSVWNEKRKRDLKFLGLYEVQPGLTTTSADDEGLYVGLHVDSWVSGEVSTRVNGNPNRICLNLGPEPRYFLFQNLSLRRIVSKFPDSYPENPTDFGLRFLNENKAYPVLKVRVDPGEAYVSPTEIVIHDSTTEGKIYRDAATTVIGSFTQEMIGNIFKESDSV